MYNSAAVDRVAEESRLNLASFTSLVIAPRTRAAPGGTYHACQSAVNILIVAF